MTDEISKRARVGSAGSGRAESAQQQDSMADSDVAAALGLWVALARAYKAVSSRAAADIAHYDLTPGEFAVLEALYHKGPLLLVELQKKTLVSSGGITYLVDRLEERGLAERRPCPTDRRARYAALTPAGEDLIARIFPGHARAIQSALAALEPAEQEHVARSLKRLGPKAEHDSTAEVVSEEPGRPT